MGTPGVERIRASLTTAGCHGDEKENSPDHVRTEDAVAKLTEKDFVKEWLWRRSDRSFTHLPGIVRDRASSKSIQPPDGILQKSSQNGLLQGSDKQMEGHNLNFMLSRMESRSPEQKSWVPSDYESYYSQRSLLNSYNKDQCHWSAYCKAFVVVTIFLLVAWGIAVPLYFTVGPGTRPWNADQIPAKDPEAKMAKVIGSKAPAVLNAVNCSMRIINRQYTQYLENKYSAEFQSLRLKIESALKEVFEEKSQFNKVVVTSFSRYYLNSPGSLVVTFAVLFKKKRPDVKEYTHHVLVNYIMTHWSMLDAYRVDLGSIHVSYISNKCADQNGGCSHICVWTLLGDGYECQCPSGYVLMSDSKTCFTAVLDLALLTTDSIPCSGTHFQCHNGSCIPQQWLCDGVRDCKTGEDENSSVCRKKISDLPKAPVAMAQHQQRHLVQSTTASHFEPEDNRLQTTEQYKDKTVAQVPTTQAQTETNIMKISHGKIYKSSAERQDKLPSYSEMNGSQLQDSGRVKDPKLTAFKRFKLFG